MAGDNHDSKNANNHNSSSAVANSKINTKPSKNGGSRKIVLDVVMNAAHLSHFFYEWKHPSTRGKIDKISREWRRCLWDACQISIDYWLSKGKRPAVVVKQDMCKFFKECNFPESYYRDYVIPAPSRDQKNVDDLFMLRLAYE